MKTGTPIPAACAAFIGMFLFQGSNGALRMLGGALLAIGILLAIYDHDSPVRR